MGGKGLNVPIWKCCQFQVQLPKRGSKVVAPEIPTFRNPGDIKPERTCFPTAPESGTMSLIHGGLRKCDGDRTTAKQLSARTAGNKQGKER